MTADSFSTLEAFLRREFSIYEEMVRDVDDNDYARALANAFFIAMEDKFSEGNSLPQVIEFVAETRTRFDDTGDKIDPEVAEKLIRTAGLGEDGLMEDMDPRALGAAETALLAALVVRDQWTNDQISDLISEAREITAEQTSTN